MRTPLIIALTLGIVACQNLPGETVTSPRSGLNLPLSPISCRNRRSASSFSSLRRTIRHRSIPGAIVVLMWIYYSAQIFLLGAEFTKIHASRRGTPPAVRALA
jgi:hypothetical protein